MCFQTLPIFSDLGATMAYNFLRSMTSKKTWTKLSRPSYAERQDLWHGLIVNTSLRTREKIRGCILLLHYCYSIATPALYIYYAYIQEYWTIWLRCHWAEWIAIPHIPSQFICRQQNEHAKTWSSQDQQISTVVWEVRATPALKAIKLRKFQKSKLHWLRNLYLLKKTVKIAAILRKSAVKRPSPWMTRM